MLTEPTTLVRACPLCAASEADVQRTVDGWDLSACRSCGFLYAPVVRTNTATEVDVPVDHEPVWRARHRQVHQLLTTLLPPGEVIVDVGAGFGELGLVASEAGRFTYVGFEPSASIAAAARRRGVDMRAEMFTSDSLPGPVGAVVLDNVIEHVADPMGLLRVCSAAVRPGGVLVVIVPNRFDVRRAVPSWRDANHWIPPEHVNYFTPASLRRAFAELGLDARPFGFAALGSADVKYWPRALGERLGVFPFGLNVYGRRAPGPGEVGDGRLELPTSRV